MNGFASKGLMHLSALLENLTCEDDQCKEVGREVGREGREGRRERKGMDIGI